MWFFHRLASRINVLKCVSAFLRLAINWIEQGAHVLLMDVELPAVFRPLGVLEHRDDIHREPSANEGDRCGPSLDLEVLDLLGRIDLDEQLVDCLAQLGKGLVVHVLTGNVEDNVDVHRIIIGLAQDGVLCERASLDHLSDGQFGTILNVLAQFFDQAIDLFVVFGALFLGQAQNVAVVPA